METVIELMKEINIGQLIAMGGMFWFFYSRLEGKIEKSEQRLEIKINVLDEKITGRIDRLSEKVEDIDRRLCRIEGSLATQGHCLFHKQQEDRKAE